MGRHESGDEVVAKRDAEPGRHRQDPKGIRCKLGFHRDAVVNVVHFQDDAPNVWHEILKCNDCSRFTARQK